MLICIVAKGVVDNTLTEYQKVVSFTTMFMVGFIILLFAGLFYSVSRLSIADQKAKYEKRNNELQIQAMKELEASNQNLKEAKNIATEALQTAENANKAKTDFLSNVSHDIRTPMNAIVGITALIRHNAGDKVKVLEYVDKIDISAQHLLGIINNVLDMSKIEAGKTAFQYTDFFYFGSFAGSECDVPFTGRRKKSDPYNYKRKDPARVGKWRSGSPDADF